MNHLALLPAVCFAMLCAAAPLPASAAGQQGSTHLSNASEALANGSAVVATGSLLTVAAAGSVVVASVEVVGDASVVVLTSAVDGSKATVRLSGQAARGASNAVGASVEMVALSTGYLLVTAGRVLAFVPNEIGKSLLHNSRVADRG